MVPSAEILRIRRFFESAIRRLPAASTATEAGSFSWALIAGPPLPEKQQGPPAAVVMMPSGDTLRIRFKLLSINDSVPDASTATPKGRIAALIAGPPSAA